MPRIAKIVGIIAAVAVLVAVGFAIRTTRRIAGDRDPHALALASRSTPFDKATFLAATAPPQLRWCHDPSNWASDGPERGEPWRVLDPTRTVAINCNYQHQDRALFVAPSWNKTAGHETEFTIYQYRPDACNLNLTGLCFLPATEKFYRKGANGSMEGTFNSRYPPLSTGRDILVPGCCDGVTDAITAWYIKDGQWQPLPLISSPSGTIVEPGGGATLVFGNSDDTAVVIVAWRDLIH